MEVLISSLIASLFIIPLGLGARYLYILILESNYKRKEKRQNKKYSKYNKYNNKFKKNKIK